MPMAAEPPRPGRPSSAGARREFFDHVAAEWDERIATPAFLLRLRAAVEALEVRAGELVLDLGCGTGNLTRILAERRPGRVLAIDFSAAMLGRARRKLAGMPGVEWVQADARALPVGAATIDRAICFSAWPHFAEHPQVAAELHRVLRPGCLLHVLHVDGRATINRIHGDAGGAVAHDALRPAAELAALLAGAGFEARAQVDTDERYLVSAVRPG